MAEEWSTVPNGRNLKIFPILIIFIIGIGSVAVIALSINDSNENINSSETKSYTSMSVEKLNSLLYENYNLLIIDIRGCKCSWEKSHIPSAIWQPKASELYNSAIDLVIYNQNGTDSKEFCEELVGRVYCEIYYLEGGFDSWVSKGYEISKHN